MLSGSSLVHPEEDPDFHSDGLKMSWNVCVKNDQKVQECIPVGCVPPAAVAVTGGSPHTPSRHPPEQIPPEQAPPEQTPPRQIPLNCPLRCGPGPDPPQLPPWVWAWKPARHARISVAMHAGIAPPLLWTDRHL